ncbi:MAG: hypothetical protein IJ167_10895 [Lachnospiraceae bacterium]|nr:hypothetical protein [Lachnospiraceae bacterium]
MRGYTGTVASLDGNGIDMLTGVFKNGKLQGNAVYNPVNTTVQTTMAVNPALICMGVALMGIEKKLDKIQQTQQQILGFLEQKNESELKGNLNFLSDVLNNYKFNYDNERYKNNMHIKVLDIRQTSEQNIIFYKKQIGEIINKKSLIHINQQTDRLVSDVQSKLNYYKLALYQFAFSAFMEVMLLENFESNYLTGVSKTIEKYSIQYKELYTECYNQIENSAKTSVGSYLMKGASKASKLAGKTIARIPVISKSQLDENLIAKSDEILDKNTRKTQKTMILFSENRTDDVKVFIDNIDRVNMLYNNPMDVLFDKDALYIKQNSL